MEEMGNRVFVADHDPQIEIGDRIKDVVSELVRLVVSSNTERPVVAVTLEDSFDEQSRIAKKLISERSTRAAFFDEHLCDGPAWNILIDLYLSSRKKAPISVSSACSAARAPQTTAIRALQALTEDGLVLRTPDPHDKRRFYVSLADDVDKRISDYLRALRPQAPVHTQKAYKNYVEMHPDRT